jgi:hypothetical protein
MSHVLKLLVRATGEGRRAASKEAAGVHQLRAVGLRREPHACSLGGRPHHAASLPFDPPLPLPLIVYGPRPGPRLEPDVGARTTSTTPTLTPLTH